jgi:mono/diheme cytochrome c family protein
MKKWLPFLILITIALFTALWSFLHPAPNPYHPKTDRPEKIYREVCLQCHGDQGQGSGLLYPAFEADLDSVVVKDIIGSGGFLMPAFPGIQGDTLNNLGTYVLRLKRTN